jgi:hypothetical protein
VNKALDELKIQAKILLKSAKNNQTSAIQRLAKYSGNKPHMGSLDLTYTDIAKLKHCQHVCAREVGFQNWQHAHIILRAEVKSAESGCLESAVTDMGKFWHSHACDALINLWFSRYQDAHAALQESPNFYLIPYQQQFIVVTKDYLKTINLDSVQASLWQEVEHNLVASYSSEAWDTIAHIRLTKRTS